MQIETIVAASSAGIAIIAAIISAVQARYAKRQADVATRQLQLEQTDAAVKVVEEFLRIINESRTAVLDEVVVETHQQRVRRLAEYVAPVKRGLAAVERRSQFVPDDVLRGVRQSSDSLVSLVHLISGPAAYRLSDRQLRDQFVWDVDILEMDVERWGIPPG